MSIHGGRQISQLVIAKVRVDSVGGGKAGVTSLRQGSENRGPDTAE